MTTAAALPDYDFQTIYKIQAIAMQTIHNGPNYSVFSPVATVKYVQDLVEGRVGLGDHGGQGGPSGQGGSSPAVGDSNPHNEEDGAPISNQNNTAKIQNLTERIERLQERLDVAQELLDNTKPHQEKRMYKMTKLIDKLTGRISILQERIDALSVLH